MSPTNMEEHLSASLHTQAETVHGAPLTLAGVRRRATSIRRRRRAAAGAGLVAAAAVVVGLAIPTTSLWRDSAPMPPAGRPAAPAASVLHDGVVTRPDGSTVTVPFDNETVGSTAYGVLTDGRVVAPVAQPGGAARVVVVDENGTVEAEYPALVNVVTMGQADRTVAWVGPDHRVRVLESGTDDPVTMAEVPMPGEGIGSVDAVIGSDCAGGGCRVLGGDFTETTVSMTGPEPARDLDTPEPFRVTDVRPDGSLWAVDLPPGRNEQYGCAALYDPARGAITARSCETVGLTFSPDGQHVVGGYAENNMWSEVTVLDLDLREVTTYAPGRQEALSRVGWADASHLYLVRGGWDGTEWRLERVAIDGSDIETVAGPEDGPNPETASAFELSD
jgi:hypothetical protein